MSVIGTAGHVDHGKSLLVQALTGIDPDRLREEKLRGMTIDLGFAWLTLPSGRTASIVDVPGHERFIKNMLAGAGGVDLALLVVAADDGVMPQTREHLAILDLLGVARGVVALTKRDLVDDAWAVLVEADIVELLEGTALAGAPVVHCSAVTGAGLDDLRARLDDGLAALPPKRDVGRPRLPVDRVFTIGGFGTVVTGTLIEGTLATGAEVEVVPGGLRARIRGLQSHKDQVPVAVPGTRTAVNLAGVAREDLHRGMILTLPGTVRPATSVDARIRAAGVLRHNMRLTFHSGAAESPATLRLLEEDALAAGDEGWAQLKLDAPVALVRGDRFVIRTPDATVGGGTVADTAPKRHRRRHAPTIAALNALLASSPEDVLLAASSRNPFATSDTLLHESYLDRDAFDAALSALVAAGRLVSVGTPADARFLPADQARELERRAEGLLADYHASQPLRAGMPAEELRSRLQLDTRVFALLSASWADVRVSGSAAALSKFLPAPSPEQQAQIDAYVAALRASPFAAPPVALSPPLLAYLVESGAVVDAGNGIIFASEIWRDLEARIRAHIAERGAITIASARDLLGTSRKYAQAILEHLGRLRITRRDGDEHVLR